MAAASRGILGVCCFLGLSVAAGSASEGAVVLVQSAVQLHERLGRAEDADAELEEQEADDLAAVEELEEEPAVHQLKQWLVDNSQLQHRGPGVKYRLSKERTNTGLKYAAWGETLQGVDSGDGWVQVGDAYLPKEVNGKAVLVDKTPPAPPSKLKLKRSGIKISWEPTQVRAQDGSWVACVITRRGSKPGTYNVTVTPSTFANYTLTDVPREFLKNATIVRTRVPLGGEKLAVAPAVAPVAAPVEEFIRLKYMDFGKHKTELKLLKRSPMRILMRLACEKVEIPLKNCLRTVRFTYDGRQLDEAERIASLDLPEHATIVMNRTRTV
mmetsp:Transcript_11316/g.34980  ORF Transcript_11316/g.34980 Transcript_11316/m.34980 type:complete len:326 (+) Transcript_11316:102-1079(+)